MERAFKYEEIPDGVIEDSPGQLNELHDMAVEELEEPEDLLSPEELDREGEQEAEIETEDIGGSSDPVTLYLREIGSVPLLTREGEVELAKEKEQGEAQVLEAVLSSPVALRLVLELGEKVERAELSVRDVLVHPVHVIEGRSKLIRASRYLLLKLKREPLPEEIATEMGLPLKDVRRLMRIPGERVSLETPIGVDGDSCFGDFVEDKHIPRPSEEVIEADLCTKIRKALATLPPRQEKVVRLPFGVGEARETPWRSWGRNFL